ncbi:3154_t:CDS:2 [Dentiscutata erythropus]|uniref:3154_t:CDS:1 n=1 Tax=Dentiscutata erythropus TaxID=1348616 RepID=A0A9N9GK57_9GLOM|nr:3154_t:CDS:2 [Dentiscutata erythropus]
MPTTFVTILNLLSRLSNIENENKLSEEELIDLVDYFDKNVNEQAMILAVLNSFPNDNIRLKYLRSKVISKPDLLTEAELFRTVIPTPKLRTIKTTNTVKAAMRKITNAPIFKWNDFFVNAYNFSLTLDTSNHRFRNPEIKEIELSVEDSVVDIFLKTVNEINNQRLILLPKLERWCKLYVFEGIKGRLDAIHCSADNKELLIAPSKILSIVVVKPEQLMQNLIDHGTELFETYNTALTTNYNEARHEKIIRQVFGYMIVNDLRYGLLTTYVQTWFFCRQQKNPDILYISREVHITQGHTNKDASFLECIRYFEKLSSEDTFDHYSPPNSEGDDYHGSDIDDNKDNNASKKDNGDDDQLSDSDEFLKNMKNYKRNQISFGDLLRGGRSGSVFKAKFNEKTGALKMADLYKNEYLVTELLNEIKIYLGPLNDIQEIFIPKLLKYGVLHEAFVFLFVSFAGKSVAELENEVTVIEKKLAILGLQKEKDELTDKTSVWWIDFVWSKMGCDKKDLNKELIKLKHLLGILVHYIHKRLQKGYKQLGKQTVLVPSTESQFYAIFKNYIHYYSAAKNKYKYIFNRSSSNQELANILDSQNWGIKFYDQQQCTYIVLCDDNIIENEENLIKQAITQQLTLNKKSYKPKYKYGQLIVEWKKQKTIDFNSYIT